MQLIYYIGEIFHQHVKYLQNVKLIRKLLKMYIF